MKILFIRFSSIGDIVLTTPVIRCTKKQLGAEIHFLTKKSFESILKSNPNIDKVISIEKKINEVKLELETEKYDYVIDLHHNLRSFQAKQIIGAKSFSFNKINLKKWLMVNAKINFLPKIHIVERYLETVEKLDVKNDNAGLDFFIPKHDEVDFFEKNILVMPNSYIAFVIGAAHSTKRLPDEKIIEICRNIKYPILLLGGKDEYEKGDKIAKSSGEHVINTCGKFNLNQSASIVKQSKLVISHDTGLMHIAAAFHKTIISVWGNTIPEFGMYPYFGQNQGLNISIENENIRCRPCSKIGFNECPKGHFKCMNENNFEKLYLKVHENIR